jgi:uncharacterized protein
MSKIRPAIFILGLSCILSSCATYQGNVATARDHLTGGRCEEALKLLQIYSEKVNGDQLVYLLDYATALQTCGQYKKSSEIFQKADQLSDQMDYHSISRIAGATLLNEEMIQYKGDTFEKFFINAAAALNYLELGEADEASVEVRRINEKYGRLQTEERKKFELNSFSQYLSGLIYESEKKFDDACISYKSAYQLDVGYRAVGLDMLRGCWLAKRTQEFSRMLKQIDPNPDELKKVRQKNKNEVIIVFLQGWGPRKSPRLDNRIMPYLVPVSSQTKKLQVEVSANGNGAGNEVIKVTSDLVYNVEKAAIQTLEDDYKALVARRIGARVAKEVLADQVRQKDELLGAVTWIVLLASERADLRQWSTLPQTIQIARLHVSGGQTKLKLAGLNEMGEISESLPELVIQADAKGAISKKIYVVRSLK